MRDGLFRNVIVSISAQPGKGAHGDDGVESQSNMASSRNVRLLKLGPTGAPSFRHPALFSQELLARRATRQISEGLTFIFSLPLEAQTLGWGWVRLASLHRPGLFHVSVNRLHAGSPCPRTARRAGRRAGADSHSPTTSVGALRPTPANTDTE